MGKLDYNIVFFRKTAIFRRKLVNNALNGDYNIEPLSSKL
jgi:hypothetical protein